MNNPDRIAKLAFLASLCAIAISLAAFILTIVL